MRRLRSTRDATKILISKQGRGRGRDAPFPPIPPFAASFLALAFISFPGVSLSAKFLRFFSHALLSAADGGEGREKEVGLASLSHSVPPDAYCVSSFCFSVALAQPTEKEKRNGEEST